MAVHRLLVGLIPFALACSEPPAGDSDSGTGESAGEGDGESDETGSDSSGTGESDSEASTDSDSTDADSTDADSTDETGDEPDYSGDKTKFFGDSRCEQANLLFCEDFEDPTLDAAAWEVQGEMPTIDDTLAARGTRSVHVHTVANGLSLLRHTATFPVADNVYWGRMFVWIDALPTAPDWAHWTLIGADGADVPGEIRVGGQWHTFEARNLFGIGSDGGATGDWTWLDGDPRGAALTVPTQEWVCLEWLHDGENHETRFYWDAVEHPSLYTTATQHGGDENAEYLLPTFDSVWVGWWLYQADPVPGEYDVWIDEVGLDSIRIGCIQ